MVSEFYRQLAAEAENDCTEVFHRIDETAQKNTEKVLRAFENARVSDNFFYGTTGYGYDDLGRDSLDKIYAEVFGAPRGLCRIQFVNGTHAIACALFACLSPGEKLISAIGDPYDTLHGVIGKDPSEHGTLRQWGVSYYGIPPTSDGLPDEESLKKILMEDSTVGCVLIQRSKGYSTRKSLTIDRIERLCSLIHETAPKVRVFVDNCYGEFSETREPCEVGADLCAGSLIKNPGGGLAVSGGYIAGRKDLVEKAAERLTVPGIGSEVGATFGQNRLLYQGLFLAPHTVAQAMKTAVFASALMKRLGYEVDPLPEEHRADIIQQIKFGKPEPLLHFCQGIQKGSPVDSFVTPVPWSMPGYEDPVVMAAGTFIQGASIELSCDAPMREPYACYLQGGLTYESGKYGILCALEKMQEEL